MSKRIVSVQDISCVGQCSLTVALPILSSFGVECAILPSGILSNHTGGFSGFTFLDLTEEMEKIIAQWKVEGLTFDAIYTGYIGDARQFDMITDMRSLLNPGGRLLVDPAMADHGMLYKALGPEIVEGMKRLVRSADLILPNLTEAAFLLDRPYKENLSKEEVFEIVRALSDLGPSKIILTGVSFEEGKIGAAAYDRKTDSIFTYFTDRVGKGYHGTGDVFSSVAIASLVKGSSVEDAVVSACEFVRKAILATIDDPAHTYGVKFEEVLWEERKEDEK